MRAHSNIAQDTCPSRLAIGPPVADGPGGRCSQSASPLAATPADAAGSTDSPAAAASAAIDTRFSAAASLEDFTELHSPDVFLVDPTFDTRGFDLAQARLACLQFRHNAGLGEGDRLGIRIGLRMQRCLGEADENNRAR